MEAKEIKVERELIAGELQFVPVKEMRKIQLHKVARRVTLCLLCVSTPPLRGRPGGAGAKKAAPFGTAFYGWI